MLDHLHQGETQKPVLQTKGGLACPVRAVRVLFLLVGLAWLVFAGMTWLRSTDILRIGSGVSWILPVLMVGNAGLLSWAGWRLARPGRFSYLLALLVVGINILLTITDEFGIFDAATLFIDIVIFILLIVSRSLLIGGKNPEIMKDP